MTASPSFDLPPPTLISACLDDMVRGLADRPGLTHEQKMQRGAEAMTAMLSLQPADGMQLMLAGQTVLFSSLAAEASQDAARASTEAFRLRAQSNAIALGRLAVQTLATLARLRIKATPARAARPAAAGSAPVPETMGHVPDLDGAKTVAGTITKAAGTMDRVPDPDGADPATPPPRPDTPPSGVMPVLPTPDAVPATSTPHASCPSPEPRPPAEETHWLDEPCQEWLLETPADLARRAASAHSSGVKPEGASAGAASAGAGVPAEAVPIGIQRAAA